jgi:hypothetical protein
VNVSSTNFHLAPASAPENHFTVNKPILESNWYI